jgi:hypothetical protein
MKSNLLVSFVIFLFALLILFFAVDQPKGVWINCGLSEISPDFTNEMRTACRQARSQYDSGIK